MFKKRIDLSLNNFNDLNKHELPQLNDLSWIGTAASWLGTAAADVATFLTTPITAFGLNLGTPLSLAMSVVSIGLSIYNMTRSQGGKRGGLPAGMSANALDNNGQLINSRQASDPLRIIYGLVKTGGTWVYSKPSAADNSILNVIVSWGEGELEGVGSAIDSVLVYSGSTLNDLSTKGEFSYT